MNILRNALFSTLTVSTLFAGALSFTPSANAEVMLDTPELDLLIEEEVIEEEIAAVDYSNPEVIREQLDLLLFNRTFTGANGGQVITSAVEDSVFTLESIDPEGYSTVQNLSVIEEDGKIYIKSLDYDYAPLELVTAGEGSLLVETLNAEFTEGEYVEVSYLLLEDGTVVGTLDVNVDGYVYQYEMYSE